MRKAWDIGLGGNDCPLPSITMQMVLINGAETAGLWGLVSKKKDLFLSDAGREQFKWMIYVQRSISFPYCFFPSHTAEVCTWQQGWYLIVIYYYVFIVFNVFILDEIALCYKTVGRYWFYLILIQLILDKLLPEEAAFHTQLLFGAHMYWGSQYLISRSRYNREHKLKTQTLVKCTGTVIRLDMASTEVMGENLLPTVCFWVWTLKEEKCNPEVTMKEESS